MLENTQRIRLDICDNQTYEQIYTKQYNKGFPIEFEITKNGKPFNLSGIVAVFELKKPDTRFVIEYGNIQGNIISVNVTDQMTTTDGKAKFQITLFDANTYDPDNKASTIIISTVTGTMKIDKSTVQNGDIEASKDEFNIINEVLIKIEDTKVYAQNAQEYMNKSLEYSNNSKASATASADSASAAKKSETNSKTSETNAKKYSDNAKTSEINSKASETASAKSASDALQSKNASALSESNAKASETASASSASSALSSSQIASTKATEASNSASQASKSANTASTASNTATTKASEASTSATTASEKAQIAITKANEAAQSASSALTSSQTATTKASEASTSATNASKSATTATTAATNAQNYAVGDTDSAKYYYEQSKAISESFSGALRPMGTVTFANLPSLSNATEGDMYNISNQFTTTSDFKEGSGNIIPAGANVYKTSDNKWDILAGTPVTGVKGNTESSYRRGNVNITMSDIGCVIASNTEPTSQIEGDFWLLPY